MAKFSRRSPACRKCSRAARAACLTSSSTATSRRTAPSIFATPSRPTPARAPRWPAHGLRANPMSRICASSSARKGRSQRQSFRLPHRADAGRQSLSHHGRPFQPSRRGAESRQPSRQDRPRRADGSVPNDNPFVGRRGAKPEIWSYGHRNAQGAALNPSRQNYGCMSMGRAAATRSTSRRPGKNYGWPVIGFGVDYSGAKIHEGTQQAGHGAADP